jgi:DNA repair protein RecN (Recombination protein N)
MINCLKIRNLAVIESLEMELAQGFNVITGETGAGKTVIMQAVSLLLGERAPKDIIRDGAANCEISAEIAPGKALPELSKLIAELGIEAENETALIIRRVITNSSSRNYINDTPVSLQTLKSIGDIMIDTHGPHEHQSVLRQDIQLSLLDRYAGLEKDMKFCQAEYLKLKDSALKKENFEKNLPDAREEDFLRHLLAEINNAAPKENEDIELISRHRLMSNSQAVLQAYSEMMKILSDSEGGILEKIYEVNKHIISLEKIDAENASPLMSETEEIRRKISSLSDKIRELSEKLEMDEKDFASIEERLGIIISLKRKYGPDLSNVIKSAEDAEKKLAAIENCAKTRKDLDDDVKHSEKALNDACANLSAKRKSASANFAKKVCSELKKLGFLKAVFDVNFTADEAGPNGADRIDFIFSANPGEGAKPLRNIASSGEISRVMLALKTVLSEADSIPVLVFDEIDANIGGATASVVGEELAKLAKKHQLICISHLAQVASEAERHFVVEKSVRSGKTFTDIRQLDTKGRVAEIARMLGGTGAALRHATEMMKKAR